ncbi:hypothetical protein HC256_009989 [Beauveria bassiana]|nr:hypothetical protein HC256_009989 [Beauveria bassiana]
MCLLAKLQWRSDSPPDGRPRWNRKPDELDSDQLLALLPASYRKESGDLGTAGLHVTARVERELDLHWLANIQDWLWIAGLSLPPRALHHQLLLGREIVTEQMDMHLVWTAGRMFVKPIPRFLLEPDFWAVHLVCADGRRQILRQRALGFLCSHAALLSR